MGFAAEIKEFLGAAKDSWKLMSDTELKEAQRKYTDVKAAAEQKEMDDPLNQQLKEAKLAHMKASTGNIGRETPLQALQRRALQLQLDAAANPPAYGPATTAQPRPAPLAIPATPRDDPNAEPVPMMKRGGLVRKFQEGGIVEDEDLDEVVPPAIGAAPVTPQVTGPAIGAPRATDFSAQRRPPGAIPLPRERPPNPVDDALKYGATQIQQLPAIGGARTRGVRGYAQGAGAAPPDDMIQVYRKIDPKGEMGESERNLYAMQAVHSFKLNQGDAEGAAKSAFQMLQHYKTAATRYAAIAAVAMKEGHIDEGMKAAVKAYAQVPDGNDMKLYRSKDGRINYEITTKGEDGKPKMVSGGIATPEEIGAAAMGLATPGGFENHLVQMTSGAKIGGKTIGAGGAGAKEAAEEAVGGPKKPTDYDAIRAKTDQHVDDWVKAAAEDPKNKKLEPKEIASTKNMLYHIRANNDMTEDEGLRRISTILSAPEPKKGETPAFKVFTDKEAKTRTIQFADGGAITVPETNYNAFKSARVESMQQKAADAKKAADEAAKPSGMAMAWEATKEKASEIGKDLSERASAVAEANPEMAARLGSAVGAGKRAVSDAADWLSRQAAAKPAWQTDVAGPVNQAVGAAIPAIGRATANPNLPPEYTEDRPL